MHFGAQVDGIRALGSHLELILCVSSLSAQCAFSFWGFYEDLRHYLAMASDAGAVEGGMSWGFLGHCGAPN